MPALKARLDLVVTMHA